MNKLDQLFAEFYHLGEAERQKFLDTLTRDYRAGDVGVESHPEICGGEPCIVRTRIPVWTLVRAQKLGMNDAEILRSYPTLRAEDLVNAWSYARWHAEEIERRIIENETA
jgi:uncharacterized protein (DUF433 family)